MEGPNGSVLVKFSDKASAVPARTSLWMPVVFLACCLLALAVQGTALAAKPDTVKLNENVPLTYVVKAGDTLWGISGVYLQEPWRWPELWDSNPQIDNPHLIYPGDVLELSWENGRPRLRRTAHGDVKLSPSMRSEALDTAIPPIPRDQIDPFLRANRVMDAGQYEALPYVIAGDAKRIISGLGDRIYGRGPVAKGDRSFGVVRMGGPIADPVTGEVLGITANDIGSASLLAPEDIEFLDTEVKEFEITRMTEEVRIGDRLLPMEEGVLDAYFQPKAPDVELENAFMIAVDTGVTQIGHMNIVTINRGTREGLVVGDVLAIYQTGEIVKDPVTEEMVALPDVRAGVLMLFSVYEKASFGLVLTASRPLEVGDKVKNP